MSTHIGPITIAGITFDRVRYDREADVLYLHVSDPSGAVDYDESPEGHHLRFGPQGRLVGITMVGNRPGSSRRAPYRGDRAGTSRGR